MLFLLFVSFSAYGLLTYAMFKEYLTTLPFCADSNEKGQCIPCPKNAKCVENEVQCNELYTYQNGQCIPVIIDAENENAEIPTMNYQKESQLPKQIFLIAVEAVASISFVSFLFIQFYQQRKSKLHKD
ncbi:hypothetical protein M9Y10_020370 [Tritrichomonas musculus]|uniref:Uncharacterized protein n=1 Tax=Tritrichomonas musculus TaxID=1915356 RepID=A0ABR2HGY6_9EUKA